MKTFSINGRIFILANVEFVAKNTPLRMGGQPKVVEITVGLVSGNQYTYTHDVGEPSQAMSLYDHMEAASE